MPLGAIVKAGAKSIAKEKAKSFITERVKEKVVKKRWCKNQKVNPSSLMG